MGYEASGISHATSSPLSKLPIPLSRLAVCSTAVHTLSGLREVAGLIVIIFSICSKLAVSACFLLCDPQ